MEVFILLVFANSLVSSSALRRLLMITQNRSFFELIVLCHIRKSVTSFDIENQQTDSK